MKKKKTTTRATNNAALWLLLAVICGNSWMIAVSSFSPFVSFQSRHVAARQQQQQQQQQRQHRESSSTRSVGLNNFFKNFLDGAFENDPRFADAESKRLGQIDAGYEDDDDTLRARQRRTQVQEQWKQQQQQQQQRVTPELLANTKWTVDLYLAGVPSRDPSNDLFASRENISNRDRALGIQVPDTPTLTVDLTFLLNNSNNNNNNNNINFNNECRVSSSDFTTDEVPGQWKLSEDGKQLRFSIQSLGYSRTVETKGSIQKIYGIAWKRDREYETTDAYGESLPPESPSASSSGAGTVAANDNQVFQQQQQPKPTSFVYSIPPGWIYADVQVVRTTKNTVQVVPNTGVLRVEQPRGWIGSVMVPCGKFASRLLSQQQQ